MTSPTDTAMGELVERLTRNADDLSRRGTDDKGRPTTRARVDDLRALLSALQKAEGEIYSLKRQRTEADCRFTMGNVADFSGSHCPIDNPCQRCELEAAEARVKALEEGLNLDALTQRFLGWPVPPNEYADMCASMSDYQFPRSGTNFLSADAARHMLAYVLAPVLASSLLGEGGLETSAPLPPLPIEGES